MPEGTLTGSGWSMKVDSQYASNGMTSAGRVATSGNFVAAKVRQVTGGTAPQIQIRRGQDPSAPIVRSVAAVVNNTIDQRASPDACPQGIYMTVTGGPTFIDVEILFEAK